MRFGIRLIIAFITAVFSNSLGRAQELEVLREKVRSYSELYLQSIQNMRCAVEGSVAERLFHGEIALLNGVTPFQLPSNGGFSSSMVTTSGAGDEQVEKTSMKLGNPQYSFRLVREELGSSFCLGDLSIQFDNVHRKEVAKDRIFFSFSAVDSEAVFAPIMVHDISTIDLLKGVRGVQSRFATTGSSAQTDVEFIFPEDHPFGYASTHVSFGRSGEVLRYELRERSRNGIEVCYFAAVRYSESDKAPSGLALPTELRILTTEKTSQKTAQQPENWYKLSNFEFGKNTMAQFTLSHYRIQEPEGATVSGRQSPLSNQTMPPKIELPEFTLKIDDKADFTFDLQNPNSHPIRIVGIGGSCGLGGCVEPKEFQPFTVEAHGNKSIAITLESKKPGPLETVLTIYYGTESVRSVKVMVKGSVEE